MLHEEMDGNRGYCHLLKKLALGTSASIGVQSRAKPLQDSATFLADANATMSGFQGALNGTLDGRGSDS